MKIPYIHEVLNKKDKDCFIDGFLFIGDPHVWSKTPGRRLDNYTNTIIEKLSIIADIANNNNYWAICLGDLLHQSKDNDLNMLSNLMTVLKKFKYPLICAVGNHDIYEKKLTQGTALELLENSGLILTMKENAPFAKFYIKNEKEKFSVLLGATPYGEQAPHSLAAWTKKLKHVDHQQTKEALNVQHVIWITHDDYGFDYQYPGAKETKEIVGIDMVINGHMHLKQKPIKKENTCWYNPGNISRLTVDLINQKPCVTFWKPNIDEIRSADGLLVHGLHEIDLPHKKGEEVLSLVGRSTLNAEKTGEAEKLKAKMLQSEFVKKLKSDSGLKKTDDGSEFVELLNKVCIDFDVNENIVNIISDLAQKAIEKNIQK